jgi:hypothetical protein
MKSDDLIGLYIDTGFSPGTVATWYREHAPSQEMLVEIAERIGSSFVTGQMDFGAANGLLNQLIVHVGFGNAPKRFWDYYIVFENFETSFSPDKEARTAVAAMVSQNAI